MTARTEGYNAGDVIAVVTAAILLRMGFGVSVAHLEGAGGVGVAAMWALYLTGFGALAAGVTGTTARYGQHIAVSALAAFGVALTGIYFLNPPPRLGTDAALFSQYAADLLLQGQNPYAESMRPAFDLYPIAEGSVTERVDGGIVTTFSYPALAALAFVPQRALGIPNVNLTTLAVLGATLAYLVYMMPRELALAPIAVVFASPNLLAFSAGGVFDLLWVAPLLVAMTWWARGQYRRGAVAVGIAFAVKQTPWLIAPFLGVWLYHVSPTRAVFRRRLRDCTALCGGAFLLPNLPFILADPAAWLRSLDRAFGIVSVPMVPDGVGLVALRTVLGVGVPKLAFVGLVIGAYGWLLVEYHHRFERVKWLAWVAPAFVLFLNYRAMHNYFLMYVPVAFYAAVLRQGIATRGAAGETPAREASHV